MNAFHLRATDRPEAERTRRGRIYVWTECGLHVDAVMVDNESAVCVDCTRIDAEMARAT